jgi:hypothetical protein
LAKAVFISWLDTDGPANATGVHTSAVATMAVFISPAAIPVFMAQLLDWSTWPGLAGCRVSR